MLSSDMIAIIIINVTVVIFWLTIVFYRQWKKRDLKWMRDDIYPLCNGWCIGHFIHYMMLGIFAPKYWYIFMFAGFIFELIELFLGKFSKYIDSKIVDDTLTNSAGVIVGLLIGRCVGMF